MKRLAALVLLMGLGALPLFAQNPTGTLSGRVTDGKEALPGVTVSVSSPNLQGARTASTSVDGDYIFKFLPPGEYRVRFELSGFQTQETAVKISAAVSSKVDAVLPMAQVAEEVTVTGSYETIATTSQASTTFNSGLINKLPTGRDQATYVALSPGVTQNGPRNGITIAGSQSYENLFMVNGVVVNENIRGQAVTLFIEDAVEETTTSTSGISAEYGRFSGGVVNTLTKSGGNETHGSVRDSFSNDKWTARTQLSPEQNDKINNTYEATLGGFFLKDRLWYFAAGRYSSLDAAQLTRYTQQDWVRTTKDKRYEGKLTFAATANHRFVGSYVNFTSEVVKRAFYPAGDLNVLIDPKIPNKLFALNYTGVLSDSLFVEGQYSERTQEYQNYGCPYTDRINGTAFLNINNTTQLNCSLFAANRGKPETRDNQDYVLKASYFLSSPSLGSHDFVFGLDQFSDMRQADNYQSGTDFVLYYSTVRRTSATVPTLYPVVPHGMYAIEWWPIFQLSRGNDFKTKSAYVNDKWRLDNNWSFNIGVRYDKNDGKNADGAVTVKDSKFSPRLGITYDLKGDGEWVVNASYAKYVSAIAQNAADASAGGGQPSYFAWGYGGPSINSNCDSATGANCLGVQDTLRAIFSWFDSVGGTAYRGDYFFGGNIAGLSTKVARDLKSPSSDELTVGATKRFGNSGLVRLDFVDRKYKDFYSSRTDQTTGQVEDELGNLYDMTVQENATSKLERSYRAVMASWQFQLSDKLSLGGNYTYSRAYGNVEGETSGSGPVPAAIFAYPEYKQVSWNNPKGLLSIDQKHRARLFAVYEVFSTKYHSLSASVMESFFSGSPYGAVGAVASGDYVPGAVNDYYAGEPGTVAYYFTKRDAYKWDDQTRTDLAFNYAFRIPALGTQIQLFVEPKVTNLLNEHAVIAGNTDTYDATSDSSLEPFNPFTTKPVEGVNWSKDPDFGKPRTAADYQTPRTFSISFGVRF